MAIDPICGMQVDERSGLSAQRDGQTFYFCCEHCLRKFLAGETGTPAGMHGHSHAASLVTLGMHAAPSGGKVPAPAGTKYICPMCPGVKSDKPGPCPKCGMALEPARPMKPGKRTIYTCPMHPEIEQDHPGNCPKCGMALEPKSVAAAEEDDGELRDMTRRLWIAAALSVPVLLLAMLPMFGVPVHQWLGERLHGWLQAVLSTPVVLWCGWPFFVRGWRSVVTWNLNMFTLIAIGTGAAACSSCCSLTPCRTN